MQKDPPTIADLGWRLKGWPRDKTIVMILTPDGPQPLGTVCYTRCYVRPDGTVQVLRSIEHAPQGIEPQPLVILAPVGMEYDRR